MKTDQKICNYCGHENYVEAETCCGCGCTDWKPMIVAVPEKSPDVLVPKAPLPKAFIPSPAITKEGSQTIIHCRTMAEVILVADQFEKADIITMVADDVEQTYTIAVLTSAYEAAQELHDPVDPGFNRTFSEMPLRSDLKILALALPVFPPIAIFEMASLWNRYT
ncbi:MAG TPA: hypothetical protein VG754_01795, partial [Verrucomicrobiae bacterium]|nr:hypothetical protein [Verrucomicrobiae bacterium]